MKILLATDGSSSAARATELVGSLGWPPGSRIRVLSVVQPLLGGWLGMPGMLASPNAIEQFVDGARTAAEGVVGDAASRLRAPDRIVEEAVAEGRPATVIVEVAKEFGPDLIVVGSHGRGGIASVMLGSVASEVAESAPGSVLVARGTTISDLVFAEDGSASAAIARRLLETMPGFRGMPVRVVSVEERTTSWYGWLEPLPATTVQAFEDAIAADRERIAATAIRTAAVLATVGVKAETDIRRGDPGSEIVAAAKEAGADLIVMGTRGQTGLTRLLMGSVARKVLHHATCSILIVRAPAARADEGPR
jgi:nucleotide-binding universal stress UspA family protein